MAAADPYEGGVGQAARLPRERDGRGDSGRADAANAGPEPRVRILIVDDRQENVLALESMLGDPTFDLLVANSGAEALGHLLTADVALVLMDVLMPGMDGFETARLIRAREACRHIPIIFLTAAGSDLRMIERGYAVGAVDYLVKPLSAAMVKAKVAVFVDLYRKNQQVRRQQEALRLADRARNDEVLRESEALYEASFNSAAVGITHIGMDGRWLRVNPQFCRAIGYDPDEISHLRLRDIVHPSDLNDHLAAQRRLARGELESFRREERYLRKDGRVVWVDSTVSALRDRSGAVRYFVAVVEDVTARRDAEKRERLLADVSQVLLSSPDHRGELDVVAQTIVAALGDWCVIGVNAPQGDDGAASIPAVACADRSRGMLASRIRATLASSPAYAQWLSEPQAVTSADPPRELGRLWGLDGKVAAEMGAAAVLSLPLAARQRTFGHVSFLSASPFTAGDVTTAYELTRRIALALDNGDLYRQTQDAVRARDEFLSIASHELRTPLTPLRIHLQRLLAANPDPTMGRTPGESAVSTAGKIDSKIDSDLARSAAGEATADPKRMQTVLYRCERKVRRLEALADTLFDASRLDRQTPHLYLEAIDLGDVTRKVIDSFAEETTAAGCEVALDVQGSVTGHWDRLRLEQVISNVFENAIKYGSGKPIELTVHGNDDRAQLTVRDHGPGIPQDQLAGIFERFHRVVSSPYHSGLRLGLPIARQIVEAHRGSIRVDSEPGQGACFTVELPRQGDEARASGPGAAAPDELRRRRGAKGGPGARRACG